LSAEVRIRLVVFDLAGTTVDHGCFGPVAPFVRLFARHGVEVSPAEVRGPMGLHKKDHLRALLQMPELADRWQGAHGRECDEDDVERLYRESIPLQLDVIGEHSRPVPGLAECLTALRRAGMLLGVTTGYFRQAVERVLQATREQGFVPDQAICADDVPEGRPAPWMIQRIMERSRVYPPAAVVKVGDTVADIAEGLNAGAWSVGVTSSSSLVGLTAEELEALAPEARRERLAAAESTLLAAGAHAIIESLDELPELIADFSDRLWRGQKP
jgi:phosphonoacetaldehyde hydrolase